jgi:type VI secretion system Hcp family effector
MAFNAYLFFPADSKINGDSTSKLATDTRPGMKGIEVTDFTPLSVALPVSENRSANTAAVAGRATLEAFECNKQVERNTAYLMKSCLNGTMFPEIYLDIYRSEGGKPIVYISMKFTKCVIKDSEISSNGEEMPTEKLSFTFEEVNYLYTPIDPDTFKLTSEGRLPAGAGFAWSTRTNRGAKTSAHTQPTELK